MCSYIKAAYEEILFFKQIFVVRMGNVSFSRPILTYAISENENVPILTTKVTQNIFIKYFLSGAITIPRVRSNI